MRKPKLLKRYAAGISAAAVFLTSAAFSSNAAVVNPDKPNNYQNFAEAL